MSGPMGDKYLSMTDFEYVADLLRAMRTFAPEFDNLSDAIKQDLIDSLSPSEVALRRAATEVSVQKRQSQ